MPVSKKKNDTPLKLREFFDFFTKAPSKSVQAISTTKFFIYLNRLNRNHSIFASGRLKY
jgi:hypothetical protein